MIDRPLKADGLLAAKNATKIRAALTQVTNFKSVFERYKETHPEKTKNQTQDRARARSWVMLNVGFNNEALHNSVLHCWAEGYVLGLEAGNYWLKKQREIRKALEGGVDWDNWTPGDRATALIVKPVGGFKRYLEQTNSASYFKKFDKETVEMLGTALSDAIAAGLDSTAAALLIKDYVGSPGRALTIAITEQTRAFSFATIQRYKDAGLQKMEWVVADPCDTCRMNAGQVVDINNGTFPSRDSQPPAHPHCKCRLVGVIPGMEEESVNPDGTIATPAQEQVNDLTTPISTDYRGQHQAPTRADGFGSGATDLSSEMMPKFYEHPDWYTTGMPEADKESVRVLQSIKDKPDAMVTIYRAVPNGVTTINRGDWVTLSPSYANTHLLSNLEGGHVISMQIPAKDLWFDGNSINEFGYDPISKAAAKAVVDYDLLKPIPIDANDRIAAVMNVHSDTPFTEAQKEVVSKYTSGSGDYSLVNSYLRDPNDFAKWSAKGDLETVQQMITGLDSVVSQAVPLKEDLVTFRGIWGEKITQKFLSLTPGETFTDAGYVSTSISRAVAGRFSREDKANAGVILEIVNPSGTKGFFPLGVRTKVTPGLTTGSAENEWVLPKGTKFKVLSVDKKNKKVRVVVQ